MTINIEEIFILKIALRGNFNKDQAQKYTKRAEEEGSSLKEVLFQSDLLDPRARKERNTGRSSSILKNMGVRKLLFRPVAS